MNVPSNFFIVVSFVLCTACQNINEPNSELEESIDLSKRILEGINELDSVQQDLKEWEIEHKFLSDSTDVELRQLGDSLIHVMMDSLDLTYDELMGYSIDSTENP